MKTNILTHRKEEKTVKRLLLLAVLFIVQCSMFNVSAQINISGKVFGGARQADIQGHTHVRISAQNHDVIINAVYGGNDIAGTIGTHNTKPEEITSSHLTTEELASFNTYVRTEPEASDKHLFIGQLFGGGYGDYTYENKDGDLWDAKVPFTVWNPTLNDGAGDYDNQLVTLSQVTKPELAKAYVDIHGGTLGYVYGGGDNVTVTENTHICINNTTDTNNTSTDGQQPTTSIKDVLDNTKELLTTARMLAMGINTEYYNEDFLISRVFGGNNKAEMGIMPTWHLQQGSIENLYSGGNEGAMTSPVGLLLEINPEAPSNATWDEQQAIKNKLLIDNVYGGCRKADVTPKNQTTGEAMGTLDIQLPETMLNSEGEPYAFPAGLAARVLVYGGDINNVYGGNDVSGQVAGGNAVGVYNSIRGSIYGGGNGSYPYTDNYDLRNDPRWGDFCYNTDNTITASTSIDALNDYRPNAEQVSVRVKGSSALHPTVIGGGIFVGGNSATLKNNKTTTPMVELKIGSYVIAEKVFLGNNGENMVQPDILTQYKHGVDSQGNVTTDASASGYTDYSKFNLTDATTFSKYMDGCALDLAPSVVFDNDYVDYSTYFGSFYCGGNVGSITKSGKMTINFDKSVIVYDKVVGGCNDAFVPVKYRDEDTQHTDPLNALYEGGIIGSEGERTSYEDDSHNIKDRIELNFNGLKIQPLRMPVSGTDDNAAIAAASTPAGMTIPMVWNTIKLGERDANGDPVPVAWNNDTWATGDAIQSTMNRRFTGGNIYGGCCNSGIVNGNVVINVSSTIVDRDIVFDEVEKDDETGEDLLYANTGTYSVTKKRSGVILDQQGMDVLGSALNIFGGGKGVQTEIWGNTTINLNRGYVFQIFGGSEQGAIGKRGTDSNGYTYSYNQKYSTYVNLAGSSSHPGVPKAADMSEDIAEAEFLYGGGFEGPILGNTHINLNNGRIFNSFAGSCNADIQGHTETYIGTNGFPYVRDHVYGGNDLGGKILGMADFTSRVRDNDSDTTNGNGNLSMVHSNNSTNVLNASAYIEYTQGHVNKVFGGCYGVYDYTDPLYGQYFYATGGTGTTPANLGTARDGYSKPYMVNAFVNFRPIPSSNEYAQVNQIYGAGQGYFGEREENLLQDRSYILVDVQDATNFANTVVFGGGECGGVGMGVDPITLVDHEVTVDQETTTVTGQPDEGSAIIDLLSGQIKRAYGGSYKEGVTRRTVVNVPTGSTINVESIFGGAYGTDTYHPCDVYEANVNYWSENAKVTNAIYGGNNNERRTIYGRVNIYCPVYTGQTDPQNPAIKYTGTVYGAGRGKNTWSEYTEVNLNPNPDPQKKGASVYEVYGGGQAGKVHNAESIQHFMNAYKPDNWPKENDDDPDVPFTDPDWKYAWTLGEGYDPETFTFSSTSTSYLNNDITNLNNPWGLVRRAEMDDRSTKTYKYNTNVIIKRGATVSNYAYGGGLGEDAVVAGTTYIALLGGEVKKDIYAAGTSGSVEDLHRAGSFTASANAYIKGGAVRNVYGGGWKGSVGHHAGVVRNQGQENEYIEYLEAPYYEISGNQFNLLDIPGETHVVIGILKDNLATTIPQGETESANYYFYNGIPAIERNAYGGGEGGAVWGTTNVVMNNGYIGYNYNKAGTDNPITQNIDERYEEKIQDDTFTDADGHFQENRRLDDAGCIFGGGYIDNSSVDFSNVTMYGGHVRNALFGGGEIAAIGRGKITETIVEGKAVRSLQGIYRPGGTHIELYDGHVHRNVFGGGRGYNNLGESGKLFSDGYVFGQTEVHIHGGEIGTLTELNKGNGNVFGGGDIGYVYSAYEYEDANGNMLPRKGVKSGVRYDGLYEGYYFEHDWADSGNFITYTNGEREEREYTEDCKVLIQPHCKVTATGGVTFNNIVYPYESIIADNDLTYLKATSPELFSGSTKKIDANGRVIAEGGITFTRTYAKGEYVPTFALNTLKNREEDSAKWGLLEANTNDDGIIIHNGVFAGGNTTKGADDAHAFANATSVYGNATATVHDCYHRDLITIGTGHIGGLYGDGNLTLVDGYRGLNITNYGTDYHYLYDEKSWSELTVSDYNNLLDREKDYYELRYKCVQACTDDDGTNYYPYEQGVHNTASTLTADDILTLFAKQTGMFETDGQGNKIPNHEYWVQNGVCSIYAGRIMNTIQRADFCGVFGSRMVMQGAQDRVPEVVDYTKYTINRVREVSLNRKLSVISADANNDKRKMHGNYFGIYSVVNFLGALTSDFDFGDQGYNTDAEDAAGKYKVGDDYKPYIGDVGSSTDVRTSDNSNSGTYGPQYTGQTFYGWKRFHHDDQTRNNGNSHNKVALASGVYLEITTEESTGKDLYEKVWGPITGVIELDLINVQQGMGGGFVYAKNIHGKRTRTDIHNTTLTALNAGAVTKWDYEYSTTENDANQRDWQTSGNFVHSTQTIIDDCYNVSHKYMGTDKVPAHYWYIKGSVYVYDQYISAYTGATNAYSEKVDIPLTITAASHGNMKLLNVQPNRYAYFNTNNQPLSGDQKLIINEIEYTLNSPISYWDWYKLTAAEQRLFVPQTYVSIAQYKYTQEATDEFPADQVLLPADIETIKSQAHKETVSVLDDNGQPVLDDNDQPVTKIIYKLWDVEGEEYVPLESIIRSSNNLSHDTGYILTYRVNNPPEWDTWYTEYRDAANNANIAREKKQSGLATEYDDNYNLIGPNDGPTYHLISSTGELLGQRDYKVSDLISQDVKTTYDAIPSGQIPSSGQATFQRAYVAAGETDIQRGGQTVHLYKGSTLSTTEANVDTNGDSQLPNIEKALICTKTIRLSATENIYINSVMTQDDKDTHLSNVSSAITTLVSQINQVLVENQIPTIDATTLEKMSDITTAQLNKITALQKKELSELLTRKKDINNNIVPAYYCTGAGLYGGNYYAGGVNYRGLEAWSSMDEKDRAKFMFNYDALDLLIDPTYDNNNASKEGKKYQYDGATYDSVNGIIPFSTEAQAETNPAGYSIEKHVDYTATYAGDNITLPTGTTVTPIGSTTPTGTLTNGIELSREVFESLPNEQRYYAPLTVELTNSATSYTYYVVNDPLMIGPTPYTVGNFISKDDYDGITDLTEKAKVTPLIFTASGTYYYCREEYSYGSGTAPVAATGVSTISTGSIGSIGGGKVEKGAVITSDSYKNLTNLQKGFTIHGIAPTETSTLYVSRFSDINDLSTEKIITVIYQYDYEESDVSGLHITPVTERHVLNIHINFKTGAPIVEDIEAPQIILPGDLLSLIPPEVIEGASPIQGGGWELYPTESDADNHNGMEYIPDTDPLYWYQDGYWLRYYALSYVGGKTYSNKVQVSVANYHDLTDVMNDKAHHYYIDNENVKRDPKIYITDATNGVNQLKDLFDLSLLTSTPTGNLAGHSLLKSQVNSCENLEFFMQTNVTMPSGTSWTPIANGEGECFAGTLHGDGYYISGLTGSLFNHLCGNVYNLGVMGTFTTSGVADAGKPASGVPATFTDGYVENCWISTSNTATKTKKPVFGIESGTGKRIVNCYYLQNTTNPYTNHSGSYGIPTPMPEKAFYNGTVAYNLNGFYLYKRYNDHAGLSGGTEYKYYIPGTFIDQTTSLQPQTGTYAQNPEYCSSGVLEQVTDPQTHESISVPIYPAGGYVEDRFADGDFRYAGGSIPTAVDERLYNDNGTTRFYPIWPDDYIFFGQMLTYDWNEARPHESVPSHIVKNGGRLDITDLSNRVYRAPAYFQNSTMDVAHFNPDVNLVATSKPKNAADTSMKDAYPNMTAIDFAGHNDYSTSGFKVGWASRTTSSPYWTADNNGKYFYPPLLDDDGLHSIVNRNETPNLLVYAPARTANEGYANKATYDVLTGYFTEPAYATYYQDGNYRCVEPAPTQTIFGHLVTNGLTAFNDHLLVDKKDFDCPISYGMGSYHMWYQRVPKTYVDLTSGWESISLPFKAELVTTNQKGEITHFYEGSRESDKGTKFGHEYWLRECDNITLSSGSSDGNIAEALFQYPNSISGSKTVNNTFLWDYYYQGSHNHLDANSDIYQTYYNTSRTLEGYPLLANGTPYLIGFPGKTYYEFDLSGNFVATTTAANNPAKLGEQTISFVSDTGYTVGISDSEKVGVTKNGYTFYPSYLNVELSPGTDAYSMNADGNKYVKVPATGTNTTVVAFRPYFKKAESKAPAADFIIFSEEATSLQDKGVVPDLDENIAQNIKAYPKRNKIVVESALRDETVVQIYSAGGALIDTYTLKPGETNETTIYSAGAYIVRAANGRFTKKLSVK